MLSMTQWSFLFQLNCGRTKIDDTFGDNTENGNETKDTAVYKFRAVGEP